MIQIEFPGLNFLKHEYFFNGRKTHHAFETYYKEQLNNLRQIFKILIFIMKLQDDPDTMFKNN